VVHTVAGAYVVHGENVVVAAFGDDEVVAAFVAVVVLVAVSGRAVLAEAFAAAGRQVVLVVAWSILSRAADELARRPGIVTGRRVAS
jgi:hypothetical protein